MIALAAAAALVAATPGSTSLETLERMYQQSCSVKAYGSYDDICNGLRKQMKQAEKREKQQARDQARATPVAGPAKDAVPPALAVAPAKD